VPAKNVLLILLNLLTFGASAVTTAAVNADSDAESAGLRRLGAKFASAAAMVGLVGMFLSLMRLVLTRLVHRTTAIVDERRLCFPASSATAGVDVATAASVSAPLLADASAHPAPAAMAACGGGSAAAVEMEAVPAVSSPSTPTAEEDDNGSHVAGATEEPHPAAAGPDFSDFYRTDDRNRSRRVERSREGQQHYDELEAMLRGGASPPHHANQRPGRGGGAAAADDDEDEDIGLFLDGPAALLPVAADAGDLDDLLGQL
jgi:hypothetical protein